MKHLLENEQMIALLAIVVSALSVAVAAWSNLKAEQALGYAESVLRSVAR